MKKDFCLCGRCKERSMSLGEKIIWTILIELKEDFLYDSSTSWSNKRRYDFIIYNKSLIIEVDGLQHFKRTFITHDEKGIKETQKNDIYKEELALANGIQSYIHIDARETNFTYIKEQILRSKLVKIFPLQDINWNSIRKKVISPIEEQVINAWNAGNKNIPKLCDLLKLSDTKIREVLKEYANIGLCDYDLQKARRREYVDENHKGNGIFKAVICLNNLKIFSRIMNASRYIENKSNSSSKIIEAIKGIRNGYGKDKTTKERLYWMYLDDYFKENNIEDKKSFIEKHLDENTLLSDWDRVLYKYIN